MSKITPFKFFVTTDLHQQGNPLGSADDNMQQTLERISSFHGRDDGDFMISTGDLCDASPEILIQDHRDRIDETLGASFRWVTCPGNHDISESITPVANRGIQWLRNEWDGSNPFSSGNREAVRDYAFPGPDGCSTTQYYFLHKGVLFIMMNWYWDGTTSATADEDGYAAEFAGGKIIDEQIEWLEGVFTDYIGYPKIVCAHGNAFGWETDRHHDTSGLGGATKDNRDIFWNMLGNNNGVAYLYGHTHKSRIDFIDNHYSNEGTVKDDWTYGLSPVAHINGGAIHPKPIENNNLNYIEVSVNEGFATFTAYVSDEDVIDWSVVYTRTVPIPSSDEYGIEKGDICYYTQNKFGSEWVNRVDNVKGWTVDFNLRVSDTQNSEWIIDENNKGKGIGIYINDGTKQETINFLNQEIIFSNANHTKIYDATQEVNYRLTGKKDNLKLYARPFGNSKYREIADVNFTKDATSNGNSLNPVAFEDSSGNLHVIWWDDGGNLGSIYYSKFDGETWTEPEEIVSLDNGVQFPSIIVNSEGTIYVAFESKQTEGSVIGFVYGNSLGWSNPYYAGVDIGYCRHPKMTFDSQSNVCMVWEDHRKTHQEIYLDIFLIDELKWKGEVKISTNPFGSYRPSISSYMDNLFITWSRASEDDTFYIEIMKYNALNGSKSSSIIISETNSRADHSSVLCNVAGKVIVAWHDNPNGKYEIYSTVLSPSLDILTSEFAITDSNGGSKYPVLSEQLATGAVYIAWQDYKSGDYSSFDPTVDPSGNDPYDERQDQQIEPADSAIFVALYNENYLSSGAGSFDVMIVFDDNRNSYMPSIPSFFNGELPIVYESYLFDEYGFLNSDDMLRRIRCSYYSLDRSSQEFLANNAIITDTSDEIFNVHRDYILNENISTKEIRFGDFSDVIDAHYVFKDFKYYVNDAVEPYSIKEIDSGTVGIDSISAADAVINNYGDAWIVGICGTYFYFANQDRAIKGVTSQVVNAKSIAFDKYNNMFIGGEGSVKYSSEHFNSFGELLNIDGVTNPITDTVNSMVFDGDNKLYIGTETGLTSYVISYTESVTDKGVPSNIITVGTGTSILTRTGTSIGYISSLKVDANNALWICTSNGLYRWYKNKSIRFDIANGLPSSRINDIAIRNTAIRYVATANGISKMVGFNFDSFITSEDETVWNNNVKSVMWRDPNVLFAGTMSRLNQIIINDVDETYSTVVYEPLSSINTSPDDFQTYYLDNDTIDPEAILEVYINGNKIHYGYDVGSNKETIRFRMPLDNDDIVEVIERKDLKVVSNFSQTFTEKTDAGSNLLKIKDLAVEDLGNIYVISEGNQNEVKINDSNSVLPFDRIHFDTHHPTFTSNVVGGIELSGIKIGDQLDRSLVKINIVGATDDIPVVGSGIDTMIISNNEEFLEDDGITAKMPVPFSNSTTHDLGLSLEQVVRNLVITIGTGSVVTFARDAEHLYAGVSKPAIVYNYNWVTEEWDVLFSYDTDQYIDFIEKYNNNLMISVGHDTDPALLYTYDYDSSYNLTENSPLSLSESRAYSSHVLDGKFYVGTGLGGGDEYSNGSGESGSIYVFDDGTALNQSATFNKIVDGLDEDVYGLTSSTGSANLLASTGPNAYIYEIDVANQRPFIIYNSTETITSLNHQADLDGDNINTTFAGLETSGKIRRSVASNNSYDISFRTTPGKISALKIFPVITGIAGDTVYTTTFAAVGSAVYYLSRAGTWVWKYSHNEDINDIAFDDRSTNNSLYVISDTGVTKINSLSENKVVYLKLIDRAGNESVLDFTLDGDGVIVNDNPWVDSVEISSLVDFVSENRIFELDELGNIPYKLGDPNGNRFYSADKIEEEKGEYISEVFDGTNDLVKWENISWQVTKFDNTSVLMYVRTSTSSNDILTADWLGPFDSSLSTNVSLTHMQGQFIQFKTELISNVKGITPTFHRATIRAITSESVHFFTTNFVMPTRIEKGIITSKKTVPIAADIVFGLNTTNSIDWTEYQQVDENRIFNVNQTGKNLRVGIKFISPNRSTIDTTEFGEYGPYDQNLNVNTIPFDVLNDTGSTQDYHFKVTLYSDVYLRDVVFSAYSADSPDGFSISNAAGESGEAIPSGGVSLLDGETAEVLFAVSGAANIDCETFYFTRIEYIYDTTFELVSENTTFVASCTSSFIDNIDFNFTNNDTESNDYHFAIRFYQDIERTNLFATALSSNNRIGWLVDDVVIPEDGATVASGETVNVVYRPDPDDFSSGSIFYLTIEAHDGEDYVFSDSSYTFQTRDVPSSEICGEYADVPIVENFGIMFELDNNEFITLNI